MHKAELIITAAYISYAGQPVGSISCTVMSCHSFMMGRGPRFEPTSQPTNQPTQKGARDARAIEAPELTRTTSTSAAQRSTAAPLDSTQLLSLLTSNPSSSTTRKPHPTKSTSITEFHRRLLHARHLQPPLDEFHQTIFYTSQIIISLNSP